MLALTLSVMTWAWIVVFPNFVRAGETIDFETRLLFVAVGGPLLSGAVISSWRALKQLKRSPSGGGIMWWLTWGSAGLTLLAFLFYFLASASISFGFHLSI